MVEVRVGVVKVERKAVAVKEEDVKVEAKGGEVKVQVVIRVEKRVVEVVRKATVKVVEKVEVGEEAVNDDEEYVHDRERGHVNEGNVHEDYVNALHHM